MSTMSTLPRVCRMSEQRPPNPDDALTPRQVAEDWGVSPETVKELCRAGRLTHERPSARTIRIRRREADAYRLAHTVRAPG